MLTTNDVRVLRLLVERGPHTEMEIRDSLRSGLGAAAAGRRLPKLRDRGLVVVEDPSNYHGPKGIYDVTGEGVRQLRRADEAAYGRLA